MSTLCNRLRRDFPAFPVSSSFSFFVWGPDVTAAEIKKAFVSPDMLMEGRDDEGIMRRRGNLSRKETPFVYANCHLLRKFGLLLLALALIRKQNRSQYIDQVRTLTKSFRRKKERKALVVFNLEFYRTPFYGSQKL